MTIILFLLPIAIFVLGVFYVHQNKKKLSDEQLLEFEKQIKPSLLKFRFLSVIPLLIMALYFTTGTTDFQFSYFLMAGIASLILAIVSYLGMRKVLAKSSNTAVFQFILNYCVFLGVGLLTLVLASFFSLKDYIRY